MEEKKHETPAATIIDLLTAEDFGDSGFESDEPDYYACSCCNHTQATPGMGNSCNRCGLFNVMSEEWF